MCGKKGAHACGCSGGCFGPQLWSKKKRIKVLQETLEQVREKEQEIQDALDELQN